MDISYDIALTVEGKRLSNMEVHALLAVERSGSQNRAAEELGIAVPVLHNYIKKAERKLGVELVASTHLSSKLTDEGRELTEAYSRMTALFDDREAAVGCTPVSRLFFERVPDTARLVISDNQGLRGLFEIGALDAVVFDDPQFAFDYPWRAREFRAGSDELLHVSRGKRYVKLRYGAQRLGFAYLDSERMEYLVMEEVEEPEELLSSGCSYFINRSLAESREMMIKPRKATPTLSHEILGLANERKGISRIIDRLLGRG